MAFLSERTTAIRPAATAALIAALALGATAAHATPSLEYAVKASYLTKFAPFVQWPPRTLPADGRPLRICVAGADPFDGALETLARGQEVDGHPLAVVKMDRVSADDVMACQILFVGQSAGQSSAEMLKAAAAGAVLTVTDADHGVRGGIIEFELRGDRVRFAINQGAALARGIRISSKLLGLAVAVNQ